MKRICSICARGGSKGVRNKNLRIIAGKPLIAHSIEQARLSGAFEVIAVSSDSPAILDAGKAWGADMLVDRPQEMATDSAAKLPAIRHCVGTAETQCGIEFDIVVDLDATAPLRSIGDITGAIQLLEEGDAENVVSCTPSRRSPYFNMVEVNANGRVELAKTLDRPIIRRQDAPPCFDLNGSVYVWRRDVLMTGDDSVIHERTRLFVMPEERAIDIDAEFDFKFVQFLMTQRSMNLE
jgi:CMP-N,N'-diacetyllegionaminic acid synthase